MAAGVNSPLYTTGTYTTSWLYDYLSGVCRSGHRSATTLGWNGTNWCGIGAYPVAATDGYINLKIKDESNAQINKLYNNSVAG